MANLVTVFESGEVGLQTTVATDFSRTGWTLDTGDFDGITDVRLEVNGYDSHATTAADVYLMYWTGSAWAKVDATNAKITLPAAGSGITRYNSANSFSLISGATRYCLRVDTAASTVYIDCFRLLITQVNATKSVFCIPMVSSTYNVRSTTDVGSAGAADGRTGTSYGQATAGKFLRFVRNDAAYGDTIASVQLQVLHSTSNASSPSLVRLYNATDSTEVAYGSSAVTAAPAGHSLVTISGQSNWHDGDTYEVQHYPNHASRLSYLYAAYLMVKVTSLTKGEVWHRFSKYATFTTAATVYGHNRQRLIHASFSSPTLYFEATGSCADNAAATYMCDHGTNDTGTSGYADMASINWNSGTKARYRSSSITLPDSADRLIARVPSTTNAVTYASLFGVIAFAAAQARVADTPGSASLQGAHTGDTQGSAALATPRTADTPGSAALRAAATGDTQGSAALRAACTGDTQGSATLALPSTPRTADTPGAAALASPQTGDTQGSAALRGAKTADTPGSAALRAAQTADTPGSAALRAAQTADTPGSAALRAAQTADTPGSAALRAARTGDTPGSATLVAPHTGDTQGSASLRASRTGDTPGSATLQSSGGWEMVMWDGADWVPVTVTVE